jgi:hypothetical protein
MKEENFLIQILSLLIKFVIDELNKYKPQPTSQNNFILLMIN